MISLTTSLGILENKRTVFRDLDAKIIEATQEPVQLEKEICEIEEYHAVLTEKIAFLCDFITRSRPPPSDPATVRSSTSTEGTPTPAVPRPHVSSSGSRIASADILPTHTSPRSESDPEVSIHTDHPSVSTGHCISQLPKLSLQYFSGDPLAWQTFWDSFDAAVNSNTSLTGVQKFNYLRAQLQGDAAR